MDVNPKGDISAQTHSLSLNFHSRITSNRLRWERRGAIE
jgi:hypothetical protein